MTTTQTPKFDTEAVVQTLMSRTHRAAKALKNAAGSKASPAEMAFNHNDYVMSNMELNSYIGGKLVNGDNSALTAFSKTYSKCDDEVQQILAPNVLSIGNLTDKAIAGLDAAKCVREQPHGLDVDIDDQPPMDLNFWKGIKDQTLELQAASKWDADEQVKNNQQTLEGLQAIGSAGFVYGTLTGDVPMAAAGGVSAAIGTVGSYLNTKAGPILDEYLTDKSNQNYSEKDDSSQGGYQRPGQSQQYTQ
jgi:hypothetical protein